MTWKGFLHGGYERAYVGFLFIVPLTVQGRTHFADLGIGSKSEAQGFTAFYQVLELKFPPWSICKVLADTWPGIPSLCPSLSSLPCRDPGLFVCLPLLSLKMAIAIPRRSGLVNEQESSWEVPQGHVMRTAVFL